MEVYTDTDYARAVTDRRSTTGYCTLLRVIYSPGQVSSKKWLQGQVLKQSFDQRDMESERDNGLKGLWKI